MYLYEARTFRDRDTRKVKQVVRYIGKEVEKDEKKMLQPPRDRYSVRRVLDSAGHVIYYTAVEEGFLFQYDEVLQQYTRIRDAAKKVPVLATETIVGPGHTRFHCTLEWR